MKAHPDAPADLEIRSAEGFFLSELATIDRAIAFVCRRNRLSPVDSEDFASVVKLRLIENDYAVIRRFERRCRFAAYLMIVLQRFLLDYRIHLWGKWHASAEAKRLGEAAVTLEMLLYRDERTFDDAVVILSRNHPTLTREDMGELAALLPQRVRRREVEIDSDDERLSIAADTVDAGAFAGDRLSLGRRTADVLKAALAELSPDERTILRMRFEGGMTVAEIARALHLEQKPLYRTIQRQLLRLRHRLHDEGISSEQVEDLLCAGGPGLDFQLDVRNTAIGPSSVIAGSGGGEDDWERR